MKNKFEIFLDTDIFTEQLYSKKSTGIFLIQKCRAMFDGCYTSVINASEVFSEITEKRMIEKTKRVFDGISILGIPFRYSVMIGRVMNAIKKKIQETH